MLRNKNLIENPVQTRVAQVHSNSPKMSGRLIQICIKNFIDVLKFENRTAQKPMQDFDDNYFEII